MLCPRCDQQGEVLTVVIKKTGERVRLCNECDALWPKGVDVTRKTFVDFSKYVAQFGIEGHWNEVEVISMMND